MAVEGGVEAVDPLLAALHFGAFEAVLLEDFRYFFPFFGGELRVQLSQEGDLLNQGGSTSVDQSIFLLILCINKNNMNFP